MPTTSGGTAANAVYRLIDLTSVRGLTGLSTATIYKGMGEGWFPVPRKLGPRSVRWIEAEVHEWIATLPQVHYAPPGQAA